MHIHFCLVGNREKHKKIPKNAVTAFTNLMSGTYIFLQFVGKIHFLSPEDKNRKKDNKTKDKKRQKRQET
jgi:hypothetical protein